MLDGKDGQWSRHEGAEITDASAAGDFVNDDDAIWNFRAIARPASTPSWSGDYVNEDYAIWNMRSDVNF